MDKRELDILRKTLPLSPDALPAAWFEPSMDVVTPFLSLLPPTTPFVDGFNVVLTSALVKTPFALRVMPKDLEQAIKLIKEHSDEFLAWESLNFLHAPIPWQNPPVKAAAKNIARTYSKGTSVTLKSCLAGTPFLQSLDRVKRLESSTRTSERRRKELADELVKGNKDELLMDLEALHKTVGVYLWMSYRMPASFPEQEAAFRLKMDTESAIEWYLTILAYKHEDENPRNLRKLQHPRPMKVRT